MSEILSHQELCDILGQYLSKGTPERAYMAIVDSHGALQAKCEKYEARLEIDHCFDLDWNRQDVPVEKRGEFHDAVTCRDATIHGQNEDIDSLRRELAAVTKERDAVKAANETVLSSREQLLNTFLIWQVEYQEGKMAKRQLATAQAQLKAMGEELRWAMNVVSEGRSYDPDTRRAQAWLAKQEPR